jgi:hypothetical protein
MEKTITVNGQEVKFKATASTPRVYRQAFGRDIYLDITALYEEMSKGEILSVNSLEIFENVAFCMAKQAEGVELKREEVPKMIEEWLDQFATFSIYQIVPELMELWRLNTEQTITPKK